MAVSWLIHGGYEPLTNWDDPPSTLPQTNMAPQTARLEDGAFLLGRLGLFSGAFAVSFRECNPIYCTLKTLWVSWGF